MDKNNQELNSDERIITNFRFTESTKKKLIYLSKESGLTRTGYIINLINCAYCKNNKEYLES